MKYKNYIFVILVSLAVFLLALSACESESGIKSFGNEPEEEQEIINGVLEKFPNKVDENLTKDNLVKIYALEYDICDFDKTAENMAKAKRLKDVLSGDYSWIVIFTRKSDLPENSLITSVAICSVGKGMTVSEYEAACEHYGAEIDEIFKARLAEEEGKWVTHALRSTTEFELKMLDKEQAYKLFKEKGVTPVKNGDEIVVASSVLLSGMKFICTQAEDGKEYVITDAPIWYGEYFKEGELYELTDFFQRQKAFYEYEKSVSPVGGKNENGEEVYGGVY